MNVVPWVAELARAFWADVGKPEPFPRELRRPIERAVPVSVVALPCLRLGGVREWLRDNGIDCPCAEKDRPLHACLVVCQAHGLIFLDETDPAGEQRFSLAHELGHFLRHYWKPRQQAERRLGNRILEVFDGGRAATAQERLGALLKNVSLGFRLHLMWRGPRSEFNAGVALAEDEADLLAYELLAPVRDVYAAVGAVQGEAGRARLVEVLQSVFGLPHEQAVQYAGLLVPAVEEDPLLRRLRW